MNDKGFTLIEIIIAIGILSGIMLVVSLFGLDVYDFSIFLGENLVAQQELQAVLRLMTWELRSMSQSVNGAYPIEAVSENSITFYSDTDGDGLTEKIRYFLDGDILKKGLIKPEGSPLNYSGTEKITEEVHNIYPAAGNIFSYFDASYTGTEVQLSFPVNISAVRLIRANIVVDDSPLDEASRVSHSISVNIRNL